MTDVKDRGALPDIAEFQGLSAFIDNKKRELKLSSHIILFRSNNQLQKVKRVK